MSSAGLIKIMYTRLFGSELLGATKSNTCYALNNILIVQSKIFTGGGGGGGMKSLKILVIRYLVNFTVTSHWD